MRWLVVILGFALLSSMVSASSVDIEFSSYRQIKVDTEVVENASSYAIYYSTSPFNQSSQATLHTLISQGDTTGLNRGIEGDNLQECWSDSLTIHRTDSGQALIDEQASTWSCALSGMVPGEEYWFAVVALAANDSAFEPLTTFSATSTIADEVPPARDTSPILFAIGSIVLSLIALLGFLRWKDAQDGKTNSRLAHFYIAPAMLALAVLTFYPVMYGFWLSFTDADQTHLGEQAWVGIANFVTVLTSTGFLRVTGFTLVWTIVNVTAHVGLGLLLAMVLQNPRIKGRVAYRVALLLPWAIPSYISVLVWKGMFQPDGLVNDILGTDLNLLSDASGAKTVVILVNIWLGVPFMMMSLSGSLQALPSDMYEAAEVDGVSPWEQFRYLTLPNLKSTLIPLSLLGFIWTFNMFNVIYLMTDGGPNLWFGEPGATDILITYVYDVAFRDGAYGVAAAWSVVIFMMLVAFSWFYMKKTGATEANV